MTKDQAEELVAKDDKYILRPWSGTPTPIVKGEDCIITDAHGKQFIDFTAGYFVNNAGHCNPRVVKAATEQLTQITQVSGKHTTPPLINLAERLVQLTPKSLTKAFFTTGGSEATENAMKMARQYTKKTDIVALKNAYHGLTLGALEACAAQKYRDTAGIPFGGYVHFVPTPYCYRCPHEKDCATQCLDETEAQLDAKPEAAALIAEPVQAVGGIIPPTKWWERMDEIRRKRRMLLILDEIQTGVGRTGKMFAAEHYGLEPDILTAGKGLSGGVGSLGAVMASTEVAENYFGGTTPTSAGNAVSAAAGVALFDTLIDDKLVENCANMGNYITEAVAALDDPWVGDIRFKGLLGGVELVSDRGSKEILPKDQVVGVADALHQDGMLITVSGLHGNVLRLQPPLTIKSTQIDSFIDSLKRALPAVRGS